MLEPVDEQGTERRFAFDYVYDHTCEQVQVYTDVAAPMLTKAFAGFNGTIFAFVFGSLRAVECHQRPRNSIPLLVDMVRRAQESHSL